MIYKSSPGRTDVSFFFFNDTATTEIYTLSLHDALPICDCLEQAMDLPQLVGTLKRVFAGELKLAREDALDRKSTRLNSSHTVISYAVFCLKKKIIRSSILRAKHRRLTTSFYYPYSIASP